MEPVGGQSCPVPHKIDYGKSADAREAAGMMRQPRASLSGC
jgi:hypothetical protein